MVKGIQWLFINFSPQSLVIFPNHNPIGMRGCRDGNLFTAASLASELALPSGAER